MKNKGLFLVLSKNLFKISLTGDVSLYCCHGFDFEFKYFDFCLVLTYSECVKRLAGNVKHAPMHCYFLPVLHDEIYRVSIDYSLEEDDDDPFDDVESWLHGK